VKITGSKSVRVLAAVAAIVSLFALQTVPASAGGVDFRKAVKNSGKGITIGLIGLDDAIGFGKDVHDSILAKQRRLAQSSSSAMASSRLTSHLLAQRPSN